jgi:hypothetical protein
LIPAWLKLIHSSSKHKVPDVEEIVSYSISKQTITEFLAMDPQVSDPRILHLVI